MGSLKRIREQLERHAPAPGGRRQTDAERAERLTDADLLAAGGDGLMIESKNWTMHQLDQYRAGGMPERAVDRLRRCLRLHPDIVAATLTPGERAALT